MVALSMYGFWMEQQAYSIYQSQREVSIIPLDIYTVSHKHIADVCTDLNPPTTV